MNYVKMHANLENMDSDSTAFCQYNFQKLVQKKKMQDLMPLAVTPQKVKAVNCSTTVKMNEQYKNV